MKRLMIAAAAAALLWTGHAEAREFSPRIQAIEDMVAQGKYDDAKSRLLAIMAEAEAKKDDLLLAEASGSYGGVLVGLGDMDAAGQMLKRAWDIREAKLGPDDVQTLFAINDYCVWLTIQGRDPEAEPLLDRVVRGMTPRATTPVGRADLADVQITHAMVLFRLGGWDRAEAEMLAALPVLKTAPGKEVPYLNGLIMLADGYQSWGRYADTRRVGEEALAVSEKMLGPNHPNNVGIHVLLGLAYLNLGDQAKAEAAYLRGVDITQAASKGVGPYAAHGLIALANYYSAIGRREEAVNLYRRAAEAHEKGGDQTWRAAEGYRMMGQTLSELGRPEEGEPFALKALGLAEANRGPESELGGSVRLSLARIAYDRGDVAGGEAHAVKALAAFEKTFGADSPRNADALGLLAHAAVKRGDHAAAARLYARALDVQKSRPAYHPAVTTARALYGDALLMGGGDPAEAWTSARAGALATQRLALANARLLGRQGAPTLSDEDRNTFMISVRAAWAYAERIDKQSPEIDTPAPRP